MLLWIIIIGGLITISLVTYWKFKFTENASGNKRTATKTIKHNASNSILESISDGVVMLDQNGLIKMINPAACALSGWLQKDAVGLNHQAVFKITDTKGNPYTDSNNPFSRAIADAKNHRDDNASLVENGSNKQMSISISVSPLFNSTDQLTGVVGIIRDITEEKKAEQQRAEFISTASHEMRTPVAAIEGYLALAMNDKVSQIDSKARAYLTKAHKSTQHLGSLFQDLLTSAKVEDGRLTNHPKVIEVGAYLSSLTEDLRFMVKNKNLTFEYVVGNNGALMNAKEESGSIRVVQPIFNIFADPERLREVVTNLFDNAVKYTETGKITIGLTGNDKVVQIYIRDTGKGIPSDDIPHLFQKFYRVDGSDTRTVGGTGLGLFICRKIIEMYNGRIWVESVANKGSTFYINLPRLSHQQASELTGNSSNKVIRTSKDLSNLNK